MPSAPVDLTRLFQPQSVAIVGATPRADTYANQTYRNLTAIGYQGRVYGVNPKYEEVEGRPCFPALADLPEPVDAVVVAIPAAHVPGAVEAAGAAGCGGAVVYAAGFAEFPGGRGLQDDLVEAARRHDLPVCGPNGDGLISLHHNCALWGDAMVPKEPGPVALISQSGNVGVNALGATRGLRLHTVVSCGNQAVVGTAEYLEFLAGQDGVGSVAIYMEGDGDGERLCEALARCAENGVGVAILKVGASETGSAAAAAHTGSVMGDQRAFRALVEEAGAALANDVHDLLELAKAMAAGRRAQGPGLAIVTCSGGDSALGADQCARLGLDLPALAEPTRERLRAMLPEAATVANPLDYTALLWGEREVLRDMVLSVGEDPSIDQVLVFYDQPPELTNAEGESWAAVREGIAMGAAASPVPVLMASTLPELLDDDAGWQLCRAGLPAIAGLVSGLECAAAMRRPAGDPQRLRAIAAACRRTGGGEARWLAEHESKELLRGAGLPVVEGRVATDEEDAVAAAAELGAPLALKLSHPELRHKTEEGALALGIESEDEVRLAFRQLSELNGHADAQVLVERMVKPGVELLVAATRDAVVPSLVVGMGGVLTELLGDVAVIPLPASPERVEAALRGLTGAPLLSGYRGNPQLDAAAAARLAARAGDLLLEEGLALLELNPVFVHEQGAVAVDALACRS